MAIESDGIRRSDVRRTARMLATGIGALNEEWLNKVYLTAAKAIVEKETGEADPIAHSSFRTTALSVFPRLAFEPMKIAIEAEKLDMKQMEIDAAKGSGIVQTQITLTPGTVEDDEQRI